MKYIFGKIFEDKSISKVFLISLLSTSFLLIITLGIFWIQQEIQKFDEESTKVQANFFKNQEKTLQHETQTLINFIENERRQTRNLLKKDIRNRVHEAHSIATNLYENYKDQLPDEDLKKLIVDALRSVRFNDGEGFFYINNLDGSVIMDPKQPSMEGENRLSLKDVYGMPIIQNEIKTAKSKQEGYSNYSWQKDDEQKIYPKISFVKLFKPYNWYIGCTQYVEKYKTEIQKKILNKITDLRFDDSITIAVFSFDGTCLAHSRKDLIGKNLWYTKDHDKKMIVQEFITRGTDENGGFIRYSDPFQQDTSKYLSKLMYAKSFKDWQWVIGSGVHTDELNRSIARKKSELKASVNNYILKACIILLLTSILIGFLTRFMIKISKSGLNVFTKFYEKAASKSILIDTTTLHFKEFKRLGQLANQMILKRQETEHQLNIETAYFEQLFENSPEAIAITDNESKGIKINRQFTNIFGYTKEDIDGVVIDSLLADESKKEEAKNLNAMTSKGQLIEIETKRRCKNGEFIDVSIMGNPILIEGKSIAIFAIYRNITQRKEYEQHLTEARHKAEESDKLKSAFLANMSHEIRTPMNHILGFTDLISNQDIENEDRQEYAELIKQSGNSLLQLINNIIDLSKIESKQIKLNKQKISINRILSSLYEKYYHHKNTIQKSHLILKIQKALSDKDSVIISDAHRLEQLLSNLIENAIKFTNEGSVEFGYHLKDQKTIEFFVKDTGIGIPKSAIQNIFQLFRQFDGSDTRQFGGTGLGLTISQRLAELLGGEISVKSEENKGTSFYVSLPYIQNYKLDQSSEIGKEKLYDWSGKKILIVDDEKNNYAFFKASLTKTNAEIIWAKNGIEAISFCEKVKVDMILMDIQMPVMNGYEATKQIKLQNAQIPIIGQTSFVQKEYKQKVMDAGCDDYLTKPIKSSVLLESINKQFFIN
ncbi:cache domain-containing protein [Ancylomarina longa]|uniref:histidine kinase n=1 Tax=Ancylomarina longa TaxID=2487017 RepID=A0A434AUX1_9BACT|nr:cache domain-containing protein [Ancylomarina longa]RUT78235.1 response regulator [Ancylomarina longa]